jgi:hypothetical protein
MNWKIHLEENWRDVSSPILPVVALIISEIIVPARLTSRLTMHGITERYEMKVAVFII